MQLLHAFQRIERVAHAPGLARKENDVEHSYFLAMLCWYLCDAYQLPFNKDAVLRYALVHDFVEVYAGDTYFLDADGQKTKHEREEQARVRIASEFPEFNDLNETIKTYEERTDPEAAFVHAADKLIPLIINHIQGGHTWKEMGVGHEELFAQKRLKIGDQEHIRELLEQFIAEMEPKWQDYFPK